jgi:hypothetical protein
MNDYVANLYFLHLHCPFKNATTLNDWYCETTYWPYEDWLLQKLNKPKPIMNNYVLLLYAVMLDNVNNQALYHIISNNSSLRCIWRKYTSGPKMKPNFMDWLIEKIKQ